MNIKILVAAHKKYWMPEDSVYLPLHVGAEGKPDLGAHVQYVSHAAGFVRCLLPVDVCHPV